MTNRKRRERRQRRQHLIFSIVFILTLLSSIAILTLCAIKKEFGLLYEGLLLGVWVLFSAVFSIAIIKRWAMLKKEGYGYRVRGGISHINSKDAWWYSRLRYIVTLLITSALLVHLLVRLF